MKNKKQLFFTVLLSLFAMVCSISAQEVPEEPMMSLKVNGNPGGFMLSDTYYKSFSVHYNGNGNTFANVVVEIRPDHRDFERTKKLDMILEEYIDGDWVLIDDDEGMYMFPKYITTMRDNNTYYFRTRFYSSNAMGPLGGVITAHSTQQW